MLIIVPTHELAVQTFTQARKLLCNHDYITIGVSMGGAELSNEIELFSTHPRIYLKSSHLFTFFSFFYLCFILPSFFINIF